jgi:arsenate reductase
MAITIYHNPRCGTSRKTLALLESKGIKPKVVLYLETPPSAAVIKDLLKKLGLSAKQLMRRKDAAVQGLDIDDMSEAALVKAMAENPVLIERPIVVHGAKAALGRPPEAVLAVL